VVFSKKDLRFQPGGDKTYYVYSYRNRLYIYVNLPPEMQVELKLLNMLGQQVLKQPLPGNGYHEVDLETGTGIYVVCLTSFNGLYSKKVYINNQW
jgi:hypothetical protein